MPGLFRRISLIVFWLTVVGPLITLITTLDGLAHGLIEWFSVPVDLWKRS